MRRAIRPIRVAHRSLACSRAGSRLSQSTYRNSFEFKQGVAEVDRAASWSAADARPLRRREIDGSRLLVRGTPRRRRARRARAARARAPGGRPRTIRSRSIGRRSARRRSSRAARALARARVQAPLIKQQGLGGRRRRVAAAAWWRSRRGRRRRRAAGRGVLRITLVSIVRRGRWRRTLGPPIAGSSSPLTASMASRISSASSRWTVRFQSKRLSGSIRWRRGDLALAALGRLAVGGRGQDQPVQRLELPAAARRTRPPASRAARGGWAARPGGRSRSSVPTRPRPKWYCQIRLTITRVDSGLSGRVSQRARASRRPVELRRGRAAARSGPARGRATDRKPGSIGSCLRSPGITVGGATGPTSVAVKHRRPARPASGRRDGSSCFCSSSHRALSGPLSTAGPASCS